MICSFKRLIFVFGIFFLGQSSQTFAQQAPTNITIENNFFERILPAYTSTEVEEYRNELFGCGGEAIGMLQVNCQNPDSFVAINLVMEIGRLNGYMRECGSNEWYHHFGWAMQRLKSLKGVNKSNVPINWGFAHGIFQGFSLKETKEKNMCSLIPQNVNKEDFFQEQGMLFFNSRINVIEKKFSVENKL